jgi:FkbM family methyltransferase
LRITASKLTPFQPLRNALHKAFLFLVRKKTMVVAIDGMTFQLDLGEVIDASLLLGRYEPDVASIIESFCKPGWTVFDVGANIGAHTLRFAKIIGPSGEVYAFEPTDYAYRKLLKNLSLSGLSSAKAFQLALSDRNLSGQAVNFRSSWRSDGRDVHTTSVVDFVRLDDWCEENAIGRVDCVKLNIDGNEGAVLKGAGRILRKCLPVVIIEVGAWQFRRTEDNPLLLLREMGYRFWDTKTLLEYSDLESIRAVLPLEDDEMAYSINVMAWTRLPDAREGLLPDGAYGAR